MQRIAAPLPHLITAFFLLAFGAGAADAQPVPFRDPAAGLWGYKQGDNRIVIAPRFLGAGLFRDGRAPVEDREGFAIVDGTGRVVQRIATDSVSPLADPAPPPAGGCRWSPSAPFPSATLECYVGQLRGSRPAVGGAVTRTPRGSEAASSAIVLMLSTGVVVHEEIGYEGFRRRVLLPGISAEQALEWRRFLYPDMPDKPGCGESWSSGAVAGGAFIEQQAGC